MVYWNFQIKYLGLIEFLFEFENDGKEPSKHYYFISLFFIPKYRQKKKTSTIR